MGITVYSVIISIVFYNLALISVFLMRRSSAFRAKHTVTLLLFITLLGTVRLLVPIDFDAYVIRSYRIIPTVEDFLRSPLLDRLTLLSLLFAIWIGGSVVSVVKDIHIQRRFDRSLRVIDFVERPHVLEIAAEYGNCFAVLISPQLGIPFTSGLLHPVIYLPDADLSDEEWRMVFCHELMHIRSCDNWKKLFFLAMDAVFWWNPLAQISVEEINALIELRCDAKVTAKMSEQERFDYTALLRKLLSLKDLQKAPATVSALAGSQAEMCLRFEALNRGTDVRPSGYILYAFLLLFVFSYFVIIQPCRLPTEDLFVDEGDVLSLATAYSNLSNDGSYIIFENDEYHLYGNDGYIGTVYEEELNDTPNNTIPIIGGT